MADARAEEAVRKVEAKLKKQREQEIKDADRDAAEMADLMQNDPEVRYAPFSILDGYFGTATKAPEVEEKQRKSWERLADLLHLL